MGVRETEGKPIEETNVGVAKLGVRVGTIGSGVSVERKVAFAIDRCPALDKSNPTKTIPMTTKNAPVKSSHLLLFLPTHSPNQKQDSARDNQHHSGQQERR
jgi:hypothetical protein